MSLKIRVAALIALLAATGNALAGEHRHRERWYQEQWCGERGGQMEVVLQDGTRVDCLLPDGGAAVEFDFTDKWAESGFQSMNYGMLEGRRPGIVLILNDPAVFFLFRKSIERERVNRVRAILDHYRIDAELWVMP